MKDGICPKCGAENVRLVDGNRTEISIPTKSLFSSEIFASFHVCGDCGYVKIYVEKQSDLPRINQDWERVEVKK